MNNTTSVNSTEPKKCKCVLALNQRILDLEQSVMHESNLARAAVAEVEKLKANQIPEGFLAVDLAALQLINDTLHMDTDVGVLARIKLVDDLMKTAVRRKT